MRLAGLQKLVLESQLTLEKSQQLPPVALAKLKLAHGFGKATQAALPHTSSSKQKEENDEAEADGLVATPNGWNPRHGTALGP